MDNKPTPAGNGVMENNKMIAEFMELHYHANIKVAGYSKACGGSHIVETVSAWSTHKNLEYEEPPTPGHWEDPNVVNEYKTPLIGELKYHSSWDWLMPVVEKIYSRASPVAEWMAIYNTKIWEPVDVVYERVVLYMAWFNEIHEKLGFTLPSPSSLKV